MQLAFLTNGIKTICNNCYTFDKVKGANQAGGCSIYRNLTNVNKGSEFLKEPILSSFHSWKRKAIIGATWEETNLVKSQL